MFRTLARLFSDPDLDNPAAVPNPEAVFATHPEQLNRWLQQMWAGGGMARWPDQILADLALGNSEVVQRLQIPPGLVDGTLQSGIRPPSPVPIPPGFVASPPVALGVDVGPLPWDHLFYAYLMEATGLVEVMREVVRRCLAGETLGALSVDTLVWAYSTEALFFSANPQAPPGGRVSSLRPDPDAERRRAYWRMFGRDLPHLPRSGGEHTWKRDAGPNVNEEFMPLMNELLREVWKGIENARNAVGANPTDPARVAQLCQNVGELLRMRRRSGRTAAEEFSAVNTLSWFHLTIEFDTRVVQDLSATAGSGGNPADRLAVIAGRVGMVVPNVARAAIELANQISPVLWFIEFGFFDDPSNAELLYESVAIPDPVIAEQMGRIVNLWSVVFKEDIKATSVLTRTAAVPAPSASLPAMRPPTTPTGHGVAASNGARPVGIR
jgi:hypothetical protein